MVWVFFRSILSSSVSFFFLSLVGIAVHSFDKLRRDGCDLHIPDVIALFRALSPFSSFDRYFFLLIIVLVIVVRIAWNTFMQM